MLLSGLRPGAQPELLPHRPVQGHLLHADLRHVLFGHRVLRRCALHFRHLRRQVGGQPLVGCAGQHSCLARCRCTVLKRADTRLPCSPRPGDTLGGAFDLGSASCASDTWDTTDFNAADLPPTCADTANAPRVVREVAGHQEAGGVWGGQGWSSGQAGSTREGCGRAPAAPCPLTLLASCAPHAGVPLDRAV